MHESSLRHMRRMVQDHLPRERPLQIIDIGSQDVNGSYRPLFVQDGWRYTGVDLAPGRNVDVVLESPYRLPFPTGAIDVVVSGQAFEHIEYFWLTWQEIARCLKPGGLVLLIAPSRGPEHRYPVDCWRFYPDGYRALARMGGFEVIEVSTDWEPAPEADSAPWGDTAGVFRRLPDTRIANWRRAVARWLDPGPR